MDGKSLYINIPQDLGIQYCLEAMQHFYHGKLPLPIQDLQQMFMFIPTTAPEQKTPLVWKRFIDDIFLVWTHGEEALLKFLDHCNQCFPTIKFTAEHSLQQIDFLDTTIL